MATTQGNNRLAVLIDADNAQPSVIEGLLAEVAKLGVASALGYRFTVRAVT